MTRRATALATAALLLVAAVAGSGVAAADHNSSIFDGFVDESESGSLGERIAAQTADITGWVARTVAAREGPGSASEYATDFKTSYNANNSTIEQCANERVDASTDYDVFRANFTDRDGTVVTLYLVADVESGSYTNSSVLNATEFESRNRTVDHWVEFDWYQSKNAAAELETFVEKCESGEELSSAYKATLLGEYGAPNSDMWSGGDTDDG